MKTHHDRDEQSGNSRAMTLATPLVMAAMYDAFQRHGKLTPDPVRAAGILTEEVGEVMSEALGMTRTPKLEGARHRMVYELSQVAATAILMIAQHAIESDTTR